VRYAFWVIPFKKSSKWVPTNMVKNGLKTWIQTSISISNIIEVYLEVYWWGSESKRSSGG